MDTTEAFRSLKSVCDPFVHNISIENMNKWMAAVSNIDDDVFRPLWTYAVFPIQFHLCRHNTQNPTLHSSSLYTLLLCLKKGLTKSSLDSVDQFIQFNKLLVEILTENAEAVTLKDLTEDVKYAVIDCLCTLHECLTSNVIREIYNCAKKFHLLHAQTVYICTQMARNESYINLRIIALKCILAVIRIEGPNVPSDMDSQTKANIAETVTSILPGLVSMYFFIVSSSAILHRDLYILSTRVFGTAVALVFEASEVVETHEESLSKFKSMVLAKETSTSLNQTQSDEWYKNTAKKLELPAKYLISLCNNNQWKVRLEVANMAKLMLSKCDDSYLMPVLSTLFEALIILSQDTMEKVSKVAQKSLSTLLKENTLRREKFYESFKERLFYLLMSITSALNSITESVLLSQLNLLNGYLTVLSSQKIFKSSVHLENLFITLTKVVRFDSSTVSAISRSETADFTDCDLDSSCTSRICWRNSKYLSSETESVVKKICQSVSANVDFESLTYYLLDALESQPNNRKEIVYLVNNAILNENSTTCTTSRTELLQSIFNTYLDSKFWSIPINLKGEDDSLVSAAYIHSCIIQICLLIEGIGNIAVCLNEQFKPLLLHCLYKVVEKAGCTNEVISSTAIESLKRIAVACSYPSITELIADNVDYLINTIAWKLRDLKRNLVVFDVFCVIISFSLRSSLSTLLDVMETLLEGNSLLQDAYSEGFLRVFKAFTVKLRSWFSPIFKEDKSSINESNEKYFQFLLGLHELIERQKKKSDYLSLKTVGKDCDIDLNYIFRSHKMDSMDMDDADEELPVNDHRDENYIPDVEDEKVDPHVEFIISVGNKILHALPSTDTYRKALILDILADILLILSDKENQLLPMVHNIWSPLTNRLRYDNGDPLIMRRCFQLLCIMAVTAGDFIRSRTLKDILPIIAGFLSSSAKDSKLKDKNSVYRTSQRYKLQLMLLSELGALAVHIDLQEKEMHSILVAATPYLSSRQPLPLQDACVELFIAIKSRFEDLVWIYLMSVAPPVTVLQFQHSDQFDRIELIEPEDCAEYRKNTLRLIEIEK